MKWRRGTAWLLIAAAAFSLAAALGRREKPAYARMVQVVRGDVEQIAALTGRMAYQDERCVFAEASGLVSQVYVEAGDRVAEGEVLLRLRSEAQEAAASAMLAIDSLHEMDLPLLDGTAVRAPCSSTVRQVFTANGAAVAAGTPVLRLSSGYQEIRCVALEADGSRIRPGMLAVIRADGESSCTAEVMKVSDAMADPETGRIIREIILYPEDHIDLPEGAAVEIDVLLAAGRGVPVLPVEAVSDKGTVWWAHDGRCTEIPAEIVLSDEMLAWVRLPEGMTVAIGEFKEGQMIAEVTP